jgi:hypothetical protein
MEHRMKISKLLKVLFGLAGLHLGIVDGDGGGSLDAHSAADLFAQRVDDAPAATESTGPASAEHDEDDETPEAAAERLAVEEMAEKEPAATEEQPAQDALTIEVDGKQVTLTKAELAEAYKNGLRQQDYTRKTMEAAETRKTADAELQQARAERAQLAQQLNTFSIQADGDIQQLQAALTDELWESDRDQYLNYERILKQRQALKAQADQRLQHLNAQFQQEQAQATQEYMRQQHQALLDKLPAWKDPAKAKQEASDIKAYLISQGLTEQEAEFTDHRHVLLARKAMLHDALMERASKATKKVAALPRMVERPGVAAPSKPDGRTEPMKRLAKTGSINDAAAAFNAIL